MLKVLGGVTQCAALLLTATAVSIPVMRSRTQPPLRRHRDPPGPVPTLGQLRAAFPWCWLYCAQTGCDHSMPVAFVPFMIRWGAETTSDRLRRSARCTRCGGKGAVLTMPSAGPEMGHYPFPVGR
jgi:hypothetical protein